jgi:hypothetical protein
MTPAGIITALGVPVGALVVGAISSVVPLVSIEEPRWNVLAATEDHVDTRSCAIGLWSQPLRTGSAVPGGA